MRNLVPVDKRYLPDLSRVFSSPALRELAETGEINVLSYVLKQSSASVQAIDLSDLLQNLYNRLVAEHRLEYVFKNAIANKWLLGRHSLNTCTLLSEFRVGGAKADIVFLNQTSAVFEIKTDLDDFVRLPEQLEAYRELFDEISVVTTNGKANYLTDNLDPRYGIYVLSEDYTLRKLRCPGSNKAAINPTSAVASLRQAEYSSVLNDLTGGTPDVPNGRYYRYCQEQFKNLNPAAVHDKTVDVLKRRKPADFLAETLSEIPRALSLLWITSDLSPAQTEQLTTLLSEPYRYS